MNHRLASWAHVHVSTKHQGNEGIRIVWPIKALIHTVRFPVEKVMSNPEVQGIPRSCERSSEVVTTDGASAVLKNSQRTIHQTDDHQHRKLQLEIEKLQLENEDLRRRKPSPWTAIVMSVLIAVGGWLIQRAADRDADREKEAFHQDEVLAGYIDKLGSTTSNQRMTAAEALVQLSQRVGISSQAKLLAATALVHRVAYEEDPAVVSELMSQISLLRELPVLQLVLVNRAAGDQLAADIGKLRAIAVLKNLGPPKGDFAREQYGSTALDARMSGIISLIDSEVSRRLASLVLPRNIYPRTLVSDQDPSFVVNYDYGSFSDAYNIVMSNRMRGPAKQAMTESIQVRADSSDDHLGTLYQDIDKQARIVAATGNLLAFWLATSKGSSNGSRQDRMDLSRCVLLDVRLDDARISNVDLTDSVITGTAYRALFTHVILKRADLFGLGFWGASFTSQSDLHLAVFPPPTDVLCSGSGAPKFVSLSERAGDPTYVESQVYGSWKPITVMIKDYCKTDIQ